MDFCVGDLFCEFRYGSVGSGGMVLNLGVWPVVDH